MLPARHPIELGDHTIAVRRLGTGAPVIALHGFPQTSACWLPVATQLQDRFDWIMPDLPGFGASDPAPTANASTVADVIVRLMDELGIARANVIGHDWGGAVAWSLALSHPDRVENLVIVNSPFRRLDLRRGWHMLFFNLPILPELAFTFGGGRLVEALIRLASARRDRFPAEAMAEYRASLRGLERQRSAFAYYRATTRTYLRGMLPGPLGRRPSASHRKVEVRTLVAWGMRDPVLPGHLLDGMERGVQDLTVVRLADAGHFVPEEDPAGLAAAIGSFLPER